jgi:4'-phosphopantetheinyl transferase EntD
LRSLGIDNFDLLAGIFREPLWPNGIVGSITHTTRHCAAAVARRTQITSLGIDLKTENELRADIVAIICSQEDWQQLPRMPDRIPYSLAKVVFSAKEAFFKASFPQSRAFLDFQDVTIALCPPRGEFEVTLVNPDLPLLFGKRRATGRYRIADGLIYTAIATMA